jgi:hypothetical protein
LLDSLPEVGFHNLNTCCTHEFLKAAFVGEHRLGLDRRRCSLGAQDVTDDAVALGRAILR